MVIATSPVTTPALAAELNVGLASELGHRRHNLERGADRPLGVVLVRDRRSPHGHDGIPDELLYRPAVVADDGLGALEVDAREALDLLGIPFLRERREPDEVDEEHRAQAALADGARGECRSGRGCRPAKCRQAGEGECRAAFVTELRI